MRAVDEMDRRSSGVWISCMSGPMDTMSSSGSLAEIRPHSRPAWMASTVGVFPYISSKVLHIMSRRADSLRYSQAG